LETLYYAQKIDKNEYNYCRFYCISGDVNNKGVFEYPVNWTIEKFCGKAAIIPNKSFLFKLAAAPAALSYCKMN